MIHRLFRSKLDQHSETIWLTIYADLMTNLVLVFLALYGLTVMGQEAIMKAIESMKVPAGASQGMDLNFENLAPLLRERFDNTQEIGVSEEAGAVRIQFGEKILFESGQAVLKPSAVQTIKLVADLLKSMPRTIVIEGHTDSVPLQKGGRYKDNWELSLARSMAVVDLLIKEENIPPGQLATAAYGAYRPRASNLSVSSRRINRRVEIALFKDFPYDVENIEQQNLMRVP